ncbi:ATP-dependent Clp protease proteolytic subunit [Paraburkholderia diazotrophica]|uniref:ATP-dependent Clp protease proteolytic subunit n=1 Tax=Paraburkholderia diazotrophica TaxID=667676 RepID=UPI0031758341
MPIYQKLSQTRPDEVLTSKIFYTGTVTLQKANDLVSALDELNVKYPRLKSIYLYIDSRGGSMSAGQIAYRAIQSSRMQVITVNLDEVMSAATMMFCGARNRLSFPDAHFLLHAPNEDFGGSFRPDELNRMREDVGDLRVMLSDIYGQCTNMDRKEINSITYSENNRERLTPAEASVKGMVTGMAHEIVDAPVSYYVKDRAR